MLTSLSCLAVLVMSTGGCDTEELEATPPELEEAAAPTADDAPLVSETPDQIQGLAPVGFDEERQLYDYDRDADGYSDYAESLDGTDMNDPRSNAALDDAPEPDGLQADFPDGDCRSGFEHAGPRLCISEELAPQRRYFRAANFCRRRHSTVCSYEDLTYLYLNTDDDEYYNPKNKWIGNMVDDNQALCGNRSIDYDNDPDWRDFEGVCDKFDRRRFWCCHDDDQGGGGW
ncbi:hypothetical protein [Enhygromyxa salina]|nr:hypothetical protein [Enhygromyxa salina]